MQAPLHVAPLNLEAIGIPSVPGLAATDAAHLRPHASAAPLPTRLSARVPKPSAKAKVLDDDPDFDPAYETSPGPNKRTSATPRKHGDHGGAAGGCMKRTKRTQSRGPSFLPWEDELAAVGGGAFTAAPAASAAAAGRAASPPAHAAAAPLGMRNGPLADAALRAKDEAMEEPVAQGAPLGAADDGFGGHGAHAGDAADVRAEPRRQRSRFRGVFLQRCAPHTCVSARVLPVTYACLLLRATHALQPPCSSDQAPSASQQLLLARLPSSNRSTRKRMDLS